MAINIGSLYSTLKLRTTEYERGLNRAGQSTRNFGARLATVASSPAFAKFAGLFAGAVVARQIKGVIDYGSALSDIATRTLTTATSFQVLAYQSRIAGVEISVLERAMRNVTIRTQEAVRGNTNYADAIADLGINIEDFINLPAEQKIELIAKKFVEGGQTARDFSNIARILGERAGPQLTESSPAFRV
jgi:hypothetical protein